jgi:hypothetical protein
VGEVIAFHEADAVLARGGAFELERALDHVVHEALGLVVLCFAVVEDDGCGNVVLACFDQGCVVWKGGEWEWESPVAYVADDAP